MMAGISQMFPKKEEFLEEIRKNFTFSIDRSINEVVIVVLKVLRKYVSGDELEDVLPIINAETIGMNLL